jgi:hypothetical protein
MTPTEFKDRYPEFTSIDDSRIQLFLDDAALELDSSLWGNWYDRGLAALAAHFLSLSIKAGSAGGSAGSVGPVASRSVGDVSVSFGMYSGGAAGTSDDFYKSTVYGQDYLRLMKLVGIGIVAVV